MGRGPRGYREPRPPRMFPRYRPFPDSTRSKEARHDFLALESTACAGRGVARVGVRRQRWWWRHGALHPGFGDATRQEWWGRSVLVRQQPASDTSQCDRARRQQLSGSGHRRKLGGRLGRWRGQPGPEYDQRRRRGDHGGQRRSNQPADRHRDVYRPGGACHVHRDRVRAADVRRGVRERQCLQPGGMVTWTWAGQNTHNLTFTGGPAPQPLNEGNHGNGATAQRTITTVGRYTYTCTNHFNMNGSVTVVH